MKRKSLPHNSTLFAVAVTLLITAFTASGQQAQQWSQNVSPLPPPTGFVNDFAGVMDAATKQQLETKLKEFHDTTDPSVEIAVAVVRTTGDRDIFDYSLAVARGWKIGSKDDDNPGALLFIAIDDRKYFTQVSRDLEDELPDGLVGSLQRQYLVPEFRKGNYGKGIADTVNAYIETIRNKGNAPVNANTTRERPSAGTSGGGGAFGLFCCAVIVFIILLIIFSRSKGGRGGGSGLGGALPWIIGSAIGSGLGSSSSSSSDWGGSSGWGGGGGFGGFGGGGDFGGGGSGGGW